MHPDISAGKINLTLTLKVESVESCKKLSGSEIHRHTQLSTTSRPCHHDFPVPPFDAHYTEACSRSGSFFLFVPARYLSPWLSCACALCLTQWSALLPCICLPPVLLSVSHHPFTYLNWCAWRACLLCLQCGIYSLTLTMIVEEWGGLSAKSGPLPLFYHQLCDFIFPLFPPPYFRSECPVCSYVCSSVCDQKNNHKN